jgi:chaperonin GroES
MIALNDRVIAKVSNMPEKTNGGIILPTQNFQEGQAKINIGRVLAAGPGLTLRNGEVIKVPVKAGDVIVWEQYGALRFEILGPKIVCIRAEDIGAILDPSEYDEGWFEEFDGGQDAINDDAVSAYAKEQRDNQGKLPDLCECELLCQECGAKENIALPWKDSMGTVDDALLATQLCYKCNKPAYKVSKKILNSQIHVDGGTPRFH